MEQLSLRDAYMMYLASGYENIMPFESRFGEYSYLDLLRQSYIIVSSEGERDELLI